MIVGMDVDDVVADLITEWVRRYNRMARDTRLPEDIKGWDIEKYLTGVTKEALFSILHDDDLYDSVMPMLYAREAMEKLRDAGHRVVYITSCVGNSAHKKQTWLREWGFFKNSTEARENFIAATDKSLVSGVDILFDDRPQNCERFLKPAILVARPHNASYKGLMVRCRVEEIPEHVDRYFA